MEFPNGLLYTKDHEWAQPGADDTVTIGITDHAQEALGEVVYVELPKIGRELKEHETFGVVESIKAVSDLFSPVAGKVIDTNSAVTGEPGLVNSSAYKDGWLIRVKLANKDALKSLMDAQKYTSFVQDLK
ncbi:MAG: glycine cleavage system protein GcvH [Deltaproteobacteria bacterium]|nr:glycine cleavage system protein GcvH [Deltaproteobacteria bacterium]